MDIPAQSLQIGNVTPHGAVTEIRQEDEITVTTEGGKTYCRRNNEWVQLDPTEELRRRQIAEGIHNGLRRLVRSFAHDVGGSIEGTPVVSFAQLLDQILGLPAAAKTWATASNDELRRALEAEGWKRYWGVGREYWTPPREER